MSHTSKSFPKVWQISTWDLHLLLLRTMSQIVVVSSVWILDRKTIWKRPEANHSLEPSPTEPGQDEQIQVEWGHRNPVGP